MFIKIIKQPDFSDSICAVGLPVNNKIGSEIYSDLAININNVDFVDNAINRLSRLVVAGTDHSKAIRGTNVTFLIEAPRYWWQEFDTYRIGTNTLSSTSTMHKISSRPLTLDDFEGRIVNESVLYVINRAITDDKLSSQERLLIIKRNLPESYLQTRIVNINYQALRNIYFQRKLHRLPEWRIFCQEIESLPYAELLITV
jgi:hypothetical protein